MKFLTATVAALFLLSCAGVEKRFTPLPPGTDTGSILIGDMEKRILHYNPHVVRNLRDALMYEFFSMGYRVHLLQPGEFLPPRPDADGIRNRTGKYSAGIYIDGTVFESDFGDALESTISSAVIITVYGADGALLGEARYVSGSSLVDYGNVTRAAKRLAGAVNDGLRVK